jgi:two-component system LytT family response regulator
MLRVVVVDDEHSSRETIKTLLIQHYKGAKVVGTADSVQTAYDLVIAEKPDLVFLDIAMPPSNGFEFLKKFRQPPFEVIFTTAYSEYAIRAIRHAAVDYLLKPVDMQELIEAVERVEQKLIDKRQSISDRPRVALPGDKSFVFVNVDDIIRVEAADRKLKVILKNKTIEVMQTFEELEKLLPKEIFFRSHRAHLINLNEMKEYIPDKNGGCVIMTDGRMIPVAARKKNDFLLVLK